KTEERVDLAVNEQRFGADWSAGDPVDVRVRVDADIAGDYRQEQMLRPPTAWMPIFLPARSATPRIPSLTNNSKQPTCTPASAFIATPRSMPETCSEAKFRPKSTMPCAIPSGV